MWNVQLEVLTHAERIHAPSRSEADLVHQYCPQAAARTAVAGHGIEDPWGNPRRGPRAAPRPRDEVTILFVGRFVDRKGIRELLDAMPVVLEHSPYARFVLAGGHRHVTADEMRSWWLPSALGALASRVQFTGWVDADDTADLYAAADVLAIPSWYEPFGMVVLEGMLEGLAIAASNVGGPGEILEHEMTGLLFPPRDSAALAAALIRLANNADLRHRLGAAASADVRARWLWPTAIEPVLAIYDEAARSRRSAA
jgi:glycogen(starch) synthase